MKQIIQYFEVALGFGIFQAMIVMYYYERVGSRSVCIGLGEIYIYFKFWSNRFCFCVGNLNVEEEEEN